MEKNQDYMQQHIDFKKIVLLYWKRIWFVISITILAAGLAAGIYQIVRITHSEGTFYRVSSDYYLHFNLKDYPDGVDYYNAYTWDSILRDDPLVEGALAALPTDYTKDEVKASVTGEMLGDYRILTVNVTHAIPERAEEIAHAYTQSLELFPQKVDIFEKIELWSQEQCAPVEEKDLTKNSSVIGAVIGFFIALILCALFYVLDDSIYVETDFTKRFTVPFLGMIARKDSALCRKELENTLAYLLTQDRGYYLVFGSMGVITDKYTDQEKQKILLNEVQSVNKKVDGVLTLDGEELDTLRKSSGAIYMIPWGRKNGRVIEKTLDFLKKQDCFVAGVIVYDADDTFLKKYY